MDKPLVITLREIKECFTECANAALREIPCYLIEPIIADLHRQISAGALREYEIAKQREAEEKAKERQVEDDAGRGTQTDGV